jgi:protein-tyrosine phosphatase/membrane-associated phospholipid phosphatase
MEVAASAPPSVDRPWRRALAWLALLGPFFFATYGLANWIASRRSDVGAIVFDWEWQIPFAAWTIVPYWSIDVLYALSLFVCATRAELDTHARRLVCAQMISVACFLLFPLRFTFERPPVDGAFGFMFDVLAGFDQPYNQAPSLHIALLVILWVLYSRHVAGPWRWLLHGWFALIGISILTTWQHHFIDLPTGIWVGWLSVWLFPDERESLLAKARLSAEPRRRALALRYAGAAVLAGAIALGVGGWGWWLMWAAGALALVAAIYLLFDEGAFQKCNDGSMQPASWWLLTPYFAGAWLNSRWWTRGVAPADVIVPGLLLGRLPRRAEREALGVAATVDLTAELPFRCPGTHYANVAQLDLTPPTPEQLARSVQAIDHAFARGPALVCCALGFSRSAAAAAAWLLASGRARDVAGAIAQVRGARHGVVLGPAYIEALERYARKLEARHA